MSPEDFKAWRERMGFNRTQAAEALGTGRNQPQRYEDGDVIPRHIELACAALEAQGHPLARDMTAGEVADETAYAIKRLPPDVRLKEIVAVTMHRGETRPFPEIHRYYVEWFDTNGLRTVPEPIETLLFNGLRAQVIGESRKMEKSGLGQAPTAMFFDQLELLAIFTTDRAKALVDCWASPINLADRFAV